MDTHSFPALPREIRLRFGQLKHLGLRLPCNRSHTDLSEFMAFLSATRLSVLRSLRLDLGSNNVDFGTLSEALSTGLLAAVVANMPESFSKIRTLDLFSTCDRSGFHTAISLSLNTLRSVCAHSRSRCWCVGWGTHRCRCGASGDSGVGMVDRRRRKGCMWRWKRRKWWWDSGRANAWTYRIHFGTVLK